MRTLRFSMLVISLALLTALAACGDDRSGTGDTGTSDTSTPVDSGGDSTTPADSSVVDTGTPPIDGGSGTCGGSTCDLVTGGGCGAGEGCQFLAPEEGADATATCVAAGTAGDGEVCMTYVDCQEGLSCVRDASGEMGICHQYCCPMYAAADSQCRTIGQTCRTTFTGTDVGFCSFPDDCDPVAMTGCETGRSCYPGPDGTYQCAAPGDSAEGDMGCSFTNDCAAGLACLSGVCRRLCDTSTGEGCAGSQTCSLMLTGFDTLRACDPLPGATP
ncbi:MAG: hypothetical protein JRH11_08255 [Deltaproteobacteria bacterium]|nr:hypothetical protein [Deltaproteobacteria bacterium]